MSIADDKALVRSLHRSGLTIREIAKQVKKSPSWVYSRLNENYAPERTRETADVPPESAEIPDDPVLAGELKEVRDLRTSGMTYDQIAEHLGRSIFWVHSRLRDKYRPRDVRTERLFQEQAVVPYLIAAGHTIVKLCERAHYGAFVLEADILSAFGDETWITEAKVSANGHEFHTALGQLVLHRCLRPGGSKLRLQVVMPLEARPSRFDDDLFAQLEAKAGIAVLFIPWTVGSDFVLHPVTPGSPRTEV
jgi:transposase